MLCTPFCTYTKFVCTVEIVLPVEADEFCVHFMKEAWKMVRHEGLRVLCMHISMTGRKLVTEHLVVIR